MIKLSHSYLLLLLVAVFFSACEDDDDPPTNNDDDAPVNLTGLDFSESEDGDFDAIYSGLVGALQQNANITVVAELDHQANAQSVNKDLGETKLVVFGNPALGTPLMLENQRAGIDLPQKFLVYKGSDDDVVVSYNNTNYLGRRHGVENVSTLAQIGQALSNLAGGSTMANIVATSNNTVTRDQGLIEITSALSVEATADKLLALIDGNPALGLVADINHAGNPVAMSMNLRPTRLIMFGNPNLGTPLMQDKRSIGLDLPQKMLIFEEEDGTVKVVYNDINYLVGRHGVSVSTPEIAMIETALGNIAMNITSL